MFWVFLQSIAIGLSVSAPVGPLSILCMRRTLSTHWISGLITGLAIALADGAYASLAAFGVHAVNIFMQSHAHDLHGISAILLLYLGYAAFFATHSRDNALEKEPSGSRFMIFIGAFAMTCMNPLTIMFFISVFSLLSAMVEFNHASMMIVVVGVFVGSMLWWVGLVYTVSRFKHVISDAMKRQIDKIVGITLAGFGAVQFFLYISALL